MSPQRPSVFQMSRPVMSGGETLLDVTRHYCDQFIEDDYETAPFRPDRHAVFGKNPMGLENDLEFQSAVGRKRFKVTTDMKLPIARLAMPASFRSFFHRVAARIDAEKRPDDTRLQVWENIQAVDAGFGFGDPERLVARGIGVAIDLRPGRKEQGLERSLGLRVHPEALFVGEHRVILQAMQALAKGRVKEMLKMQPDYVPIIPLAVFDHEVSAGEVERVAEHVRAELPARLMLGELMPPMVN